jgi:hypothetical protein
MRSSDWLTATEIEAILSAELPDETELAGEAHVRSVASTVADGNVIEIAAPSRAGQRLSAEAALLAVAAGANFIKTCVELYYLLRSKGRERPDPSEYTSAALVKGSGVAESAAKLAAAVYKVLSSR